MSGSPADAPPGRSPAGDALTDLVLHVFTLYGLFLRAAEEMAGPAGLTAARWQVLGAVLRESRTVPEVARSMGLTRQSVQRLANALVDDGMAEYVPNPAHRRSKLLRPTAVGWAAIDNIRPLQHAWANSVTRDLSAAELRRAVAVLDEVIAQTERVGQESAEERSGA